MPQAGLARRPEPRPTDEALRLYAKLLLARRAEEMIQREYAKDEMKTPVHLGIGGEAIPVGVCAALPPGSRAFGTYRNHSLFLALTDDCDAFFAELYGRATSPARGKAGSMHLSDPGKGLIATSAVVGTTIPLAVGAAFALAYRREPGVSAAFFGDGAVEEGAFWESINFACLHKLPVLFVCEDNGLAIHAHGHDRKGFRSLLETMRTFDLVADEGDGSDLSAVLERTRAVLSRMAETGRPGFLHLNYCRFLEHVGIGEDFSAGYRAKPSPEELAALDPVLRFERRLREAGCAEADLRRIGEAVDQRISAAVEAARRAPFPGPEQLHEDLYA